MNHYKRIRLENAVRVMRKNKIIFAILILQCTICITVAGLLSVLFSAANVRIEGAQEKVDKHFYYLIDTGDDDGTFERYLHNTEDDFQKLNNFYQELLKQERFLFTSVSSQPLTVRDSGEIPRKFYLDYDSGSEQDPYPLKDGYYIGVNAVQLSQCAFQEFDLNISEGRTFTAEDYILREGKNVPVLLGNEYKSVLDIGDTLYGMHSGGRMIFEVIGFLELDTIGPVGMSFDSLDRYVILPAYTKFDLPSNAMDGYPKFVLSQMVNGAIVTKQPMEVKEYIDGICEQYDAPLRFMISQAGHEDLAAALSLTQSTTQALKLFWITFFVFTAICISLVLISRLEENYFAYGVHLLSGAGKKDILAMVAWQMGIILCISFVLSVVIFVIIYKQSVQCLTLSIMNFYFTVFLFLIIYWVTAYRIKKIKVADLLRRTE